MKNIILVTGGAGFIGSNLIESLLQFKKFKIISLDNYSSGSKKNHIKSSRVKYLKGDTINSERILKKYSKNIHSIFHFGEFSRIYQSFRNFDLCMQSNIIGSSELFNFALKNKIKIIYSATSASLGNKGKDMNLSPYAFTKSKNLELLENFKKWFSFKFEIIYFYNVYGPKQICKGDMATVIGIFQSCFINKKNLPIVRPGSQTRNFTHVFDTVNACVFAWTKNQNRHYAVVAKKSYSIKQVAHMFGRKTLYLSKRKGERYSSSLTKMNLNNRIIKIKAKIRFKDYLKNFLIEHA
jgi:UDP-glucose 4-epimerase